MCTHGHDFTARKEPSIEQHVHGIAHPFAQFNQRLFADLESLVERNADGLALSSARAG